MATATKTEAAYKVTLELTQEEAEVLRDLHHYFIAGPPSGPRGVLDQINNALVNVGVKIRGKLENDYGGALYLKWKP